MHLTRRISYMVLLCFAVVQSTWAASDQELEKSFLDALRHDGNGIRQERAGKAIRAYKAAGILPYKAQRSDYTDYYVVGKPTSFMGNQLVFLMEEYQSKYVGCCVNPGAGAYVRVTGSIEPMRAFARSNKCRLDEYSDRKALLDTIPVTAGMEPGKYAALLCQESDEAESATAAEPPPPPALQPVAPAPTRQVMGGSLGGPMLCMINGKSKPTMYLDLGANDEFKLVRDGNRPVSGRWGSGSFQGQNAIMLVTPPSSEERFPDLYTAYENSIKIAQGAISLTLARRSTFPGSGSAEAYEAVCIKAKPLTLEQAKQLTGANQKNNPLRPEMLTRRQQEKANRPSDAYCTHLEDTYADRPALQKRLLAQMGCG